jgi:hypothetical protein
VAGRRRRADPRLALRRARARWRIRRMRAPAAALHVRGSGPPGSPRPFLHGTGARGGRGRSICVGWGAATAWRRTFPAMDAATACPGGRRSTPPSRSPSSSSAAAPPGAPTWSVCRWRPGGAHAAGWTPGAAGSGGDRRLRRLAGVVDRADEAGGGGGITPHPPGPGDRPVRPDARVAASGRDRFTADMHAVSPRAFRRAFVDGIGVRVSSQEVGAPARPCWWRASRRPRPSAPPTPP